MYVRFTNWKQLLEETDELQERPAIEFEQTRLRFEPRQSWLLGRTDLDTWKETATDEGAERSRRRRPSTPHWSSYRRWTRRRPSRALAAAASGSWGGVLYTVGLGLDRGNLSPLFFLSENRLKQNPKIPIIVYNLTKLQMLFWTQIRGNLYMFTINSTLRLQLRSWIFHTYYGLKSQILVNCKELCQD
jgi:hypothetical protein